MTAERCPAVHWFSVDPPGIGKQCVLNHGDHGWSTSDPHLDEDGRWWAVVTGFGTVEPERRPDLPGTGSHTPLSVVIKDGVLSVEIGLDVLAHSSLLSDFAYECADPERTGSGKDPRGVFKISDAAGFAEEVRGALLDEAEDGSSLLTRLFDDACQKAVEDGSEHWVEIRSEDDR